MFYFVKIAKRLYLLAYKTLHPPPPKNKKQLTLTDDFYFVIYLTLNPPVM